MAPEKKRTRATSEDSAFVGSDDDLSIASAAASDDEVDISSALTGRTNKKRKLGAGPLAPVDSDIDGDGDDAIEELIRESIAKRNTKEGAEVVKHANGGKRKKRLARDEVGEGASKSIGMLSRVDRWLCTVTYFP